MGVDGPRPLGPRPSGGPARRPGAQQGQQWLLTLLPAFPVLLLVLRLWQLSRQDMPTMLLLVQYVSPLGLLSALLIALVWAFPLLVLGTGVLGSVLRVSAPERFDPDRSLLAYVTARTPGWVLAGASVLAALTWQMRFLPALLMIVLWLVGLRIRRRYPDRADLLLALGLVLPLLAGLVAYVWLGPAIVSALRHGELATAALLGVPPAAAVVLTGPIPRRSAPLLTQLASYVLAAVVPLVSGTVFLRVPLLPSVAVEVGPPPPEPAVEVVPGQAITVTDRMTIVLDGNGRVRFLPNEEVRAQILCPGPERLPVSEVSVHGWPVERTALDWMMPRQRPEPVDSRCSGRLEVPPRPAGG
ncbi:hypothetical protein [Micromonospora sp. NPDC093277]|uniref:hypothetical protein n=1 Tax=Micromonospora sp. NPDC093277 TaxID=3364291 RepID=UPI0037FCA87A